MSSSPSITQPRGISPIRACAARVRPGLDLRRELIAMAALHGLRAAAVATCVGSLTRVVLRHANRSEPTIRTGFFEIISLVGTLGPDGAHLHLGIADSDGNMAGGHLLDGSLIYTTAEVVFVELTEVEFRRVHDPATSYRELIVTERPSSEER